MGVAGLPTRPVGRGSIRTRRLPLLARLMNVVQQGKAGLLLQAPRIIFGPALRPAAQIIAVLGMSLSLFWIWIGLFICPPRDPQRGRYILAGLQVERLATAIEQYRADCGMYPATAEGLQVLVQGQSDCWHGPYVKQIPLDPWQSPYGYRLAESAAPEILSYGADRVPGGELYDADISSRNLQRPIPDSPLEIRVRRLLIGSWVGAWLCLVGSLILLTRAAKGP